MKDGGTRKHGLAALLIGGAVAANEWKVALATFGVYTLANVFQAWRSEGCEE